ncbi:WAT1-related protein At5g40230 isoform X2 [Rosa chinensis]|uniref:WAT1-related protein At5g40230 isoform X2 n=1 Tax=Rosa chinensis TaxID=74649 RepID=UPI001AD8F228|nr:WAT1-related protein At5g40230 isoform X2 [Rosa chinensis]XP_040371403.1 WAT1-related protein At5g40230 isoform X2 [Rosa chinensis]
MEWMSGHKDVLPFTTMIIVECIKVGSGVFFKAAALRGLSYYVLIVYSYAIATILLLPLLFIFRRTGLPPFKLSLIFKLFLLGIIGFSGSLCVYKGIEYSSPTLASAIGNLSPAFIFILAVTFSMERLNWRSRSTRAKVMGTLVSISGALVVVLYKAPNNSITYDSIHSRNVRKEWVKGGLLLTLGYLLFSMWAILQTHIMKTYPDELVLAFLYNLCGTIVSAPTCLIAEKNLIAWILTPGIPLLATIYPGSGGCLLPLFLLGVLCFILWHPCSHMGHAHEGSCVCSKLQAIINCYCCCFEFHIPW